MSLQETSRFVNDSMSTTVGLSPPKMIAQRKFGIKREKNSKVSYPIKVTTIDKIIYPVKTKRGLKFEKKKKKENI
jgi:hypothetical protein